jgi:hypothetical protein
MNAALHATELDWETAFAYRLNRNDREGAASKVSRKSGNLPGRSNWNLRGRGTEALLASSSRISNPVSNWRRGFFMARIIFITGGARSGKSRLAERIAEDLGRPSATSQPVRRMTPKWQSE